MRATCIQFGTLAECRDPNSCTRKECGRATVFTRGAALINSRDEIAEIEYEEIPADVDGSGERLSARLSITSINLLGVRLAPSLAIKAALEAELERRVKEDVDTQREIDYHADDARG